MFYSNNLGPFSIFFPTGSRCFWGPTSRRESCVLAQETRWTAAF